MAGVESLRVLAALRGHSLQGLQGSLPRRWKILWPMGEPEVKLLPATTFFIFVPTQLRSV